LSLTHYLNKCSQRIDRVLADHIAAYDAHPQLLNAMKYSLFNGGKRVRPVLVYACAEAISDIRQSTTTVSDYAAMAIEAIHAYSLIHDDLPAMDDDDLRRGKPTCHIAFGEATAILAGDALQAFAFNILCEAVEADPSIQLQMIHTLSHASGANGMVGGQSIDLASVEQTLTLNQLETMHRLKTGALISASTRLGALSTGIASEAQLRALHEYANAIGLAFQVQDDILDVTSDTHTLGKQQGADAALNKPTYISLLGVDAAQKKAKALHEQALDALSGFDYRADNLRHLSAYIINRRS
jgi:geranylgeranyl diphosphate synthase, type II